MAYFTAINLRDVLLDADLVDLKRGLLHRLLVNADPIVFL
jgi:hypothetical protein